MENEHYQRMSVTTLHVERFSFERRKVIGFAITMPHDWLKKLAPHFHPIRSKTKTNRDSLARIFPRFASATCNYYEFWLAHCNVYGFGDWLEWLLWFWFYDAQLKTALSVVWAIEHFFLIKNRDSSVVVFCRWFTPLKYNFYLCNKCNVFNWSTG